MPPSRGGRRSQQFSWNSTISCSWPRALVKQPGKRRIRSFRPAHCDGLAERAGFEPAIPIPRDTRSPGVPVRPLQHLSAASGVEAWLGQPFGGEGGIRTHGSDKSEQRFSRPPPSSTRPPLQGLAEYTMAPTTARGCSSPSLWRTFVCLDTLPGLAYHAWWWRCIADTWLRCAEDVGLWAGASSSGAE